MPLVLVQKKTWNFKKRTTCRTALNTFWQFLVEGLGLHYLIDNAQGPRLHVKIWPQTVGSNKSTADDKISKQSWKNTTDKQIITNEPLDKHYNKQLYIEHLKLCQLGMCRFQSHPFKQKETKLKFSCISVLTCSASRLLTAIRWHEKWDITTIIFLPKLSNRTVLKTISHDYCNEVWSSSTQWSSFTAIIKPSLRNHCR